MARVLLIDPPWYALQNHKIETISIGLAYIAAVLREGGHKCLIYNGEFNLTKSVKPGALIIDYKTYLKQTSKESEKYKITWQRIQHLLETFKPDIVGFRVTTPKYLVSLNIANDIKNFDENIKIVFGGPHPTILPEETIKEDSIDFVVRQEGEYTMLELVEAIEKNKPLSQIKGLTTKKFSNLPRPYIYDLDSLPFPAWDLVYEKEKHNPDNFASILTSRGCPYNCIYCASKKIWGQKIRFRSIENVMEELKLLKERYNIDTVRFNDDSFTIDKERILKLCELIKPLKIKWICDTRVDLISYDLLKKMKEAGCLQINFGVESGNPEMLKFIKKGITIAQVKKAFSMTNELGISTAAYFMMGFPGETKEQINDSISLMKEVCASAPCWGLVTPYPGTELYEIAEKQNLIPKISDWSKFFHQSPDMKLTENLSQEEFLDISKKIQRYIYFSTFRYYIKNPILLFKRLKNKL